MVKLKNKPMTLEHLNTLNKDDLFTEFFKCCGSNSWADKMRRRVPFDDQDELMFYAKRAWENCAEDSIIEAFRAHPKIGDTASLAKKFQNTKDWAGKEQSGIDGANSAILERLVVQNEEYFEKFRYIFIVFATGKSAEEMLEILESRLPNNAADELKIAAAEQLKITLLRLEKLLA